MSRLVGCNFWTARDRLSICATGLLRRLSARGLTGQVSVCKGYERISQQVPYSVGAPELDALVQSIPSSENAIQLSCYPCCGDTEFSLVIYVAGDRFEKELGGLEVRGPIYGWCSVSQLSGNTGQYERYFNPLSGANSREPRYPGDSAVALFIMMCGIDDLDNEPVGHGMLNLSVCWVNPFGASYLFHRDPKEFALDFARIYANFHWGTRVGRTFGLDKSIWDLEGSPRTLMLVDEPLDFERWSNDEDEKLISFLQGFQRRDAETLSALSGKEITELLHAVADSDPSVTFLDFQDRGLCVAVPFPNLLASVFQRVTELAL